MVLNVHIYVIAVFAVIFLLVVGSGSGMMVYLYLSSKRKDSEKGLKDDNVITRLDSCESDINVLKAFIEPDLGTEFRDAAILGGKFRDLKDPIPEEVYDQDFNDTKKFAIPTFEAPPPLQETRNLMKKLKEVLKRKSNWNRDELLEELGIENDQNE